MSPVKSVNLVPLSTKLSVRTGHMGNSSYRRHRLHIDPPNHIPPPVF